MVFLPISVQVSLKLSGFASYALAKLTSVPAGAAIADEVVPLPRRNPVPTVTTTGRWSATQATRFSLCKDQVQAAALPIDKCSSNLQPEYFFSGWELTSLFLEGDTTSKGLARRKYLLVMAFNCLKKKKSLGSYK